jgi:hypothetical protein
MLYTYCCNIKMPLHFLRVYLSSTLLCVSKMVNSMNKSNNTNTNKLLFITDIQCIFSEVKRAYSSEFHGVGYTDCIILCNTKTTQKPAYINNANVSILFRKGLKVSICKHQRKFEMYYLLFEKSQF